MRHITSFVSTVSKGIAFCTSVAFLALGASGPAAAFFGPVGSDVAFFGQVGVVFNANQAVRVNVSNYGSPGGAACVAQVQFFDGSTGTLLKRVELTVPPDGSKSADLGVTELILQKGKVPIYASVVIIRPCVNQANPIPYRTVLEVFDKVSGRTAVALYPDPTGAKQFPPNWGLFPALTVASGQVMRLNVVGFETGDFEPPIVRPNERQSACTVLLTIFDPDGGRVGQARAELETGMGTFLDVAITAGNVPPIPLRAVGEPIASSGHDKSLCSNLVFSVEVYDAATGIDTLLVAPLDPD